MTEMVRYFYILNEQLAGIFMNGHRYITATALKSEPGYFPKINKVYKLMRWSDVIIEFNEQGRHRYIKQRRGDNSKDIDPEEFTYIKLASIDVKDLIY